MSWKAVIELAEPARDAVSNRLFELGTLGVEERDDGLFGWFDAARDPDELRLELERYLTALNNLPEAPAGLWRVRLEPVVDEDWQAGWKAQWQQQHVGRHLSICPSWIDPQESDTRRILRLDPGNAFGTGTHESTRLLLEWLDGIGDLATLNVLDAGCGTGILALAALKLGAAFAVGIDIDMVAVEAARENAKQNGLRAASFFKQADPRQMESEVQFDLVLANIQRSVIEEYFADLLRLTRPTGRLLLAGLLETEEESIRALANAWKLPEPEVRHMGEWIAIGLVRPPGSEV